MYQGPAGGHARGVAHLQRYGQPTPKASMDFSKVAWCSADFDTLTGNFSKGMHFSQGSYEAIASRFFTTLDYDTFYLEYDNLRSGGFEPLRYLPRHKNVVLGVVTTKDPELEDKEALKQRVTEAAGIIAQGQGRSVEEVMGNVGVSPQCGFASVAVGAEGMDEGRMFEKLGLVREVAEELWPGRA